jgi:molybdopterin converting factor small subunit
MAVTLYLPAVLARIVDARSLDASGGTVGEIVADIARRYPALAPRLREASGEPYPFVTFYLNDEDIRFRGGFSAAVRDGDELTVVPAIAGG